MKLFFLFFGFLLSPLAWSANHIYQLEDGPSVQGFSKLAGVVDVIAQLNIVILRDTALAPAHAIDLGAPSRIQLEKPAAVGVAPKDAWGLEAIDVQGAWQYAQGEGVIVAVVDTGIELTNTDLAPNIWINGGEVGVDSSGRDKASNGVDDDNNGYVDDLNGWDFVAQKAPQKDHHFHGSHVSGIIAASAGPRVAGVAPKAKLMSLPFMDGAGGGSDVDAAKAFVYAADNGARIINCSWGSYGRNPIIEKAIDYARSKGVLIVAAAGNNGKNTDRQAHCPSSAPSDAILAVGATKDASGRRASYSNFGQLTVDVAAPGSEIKSTVKTNHYKFMSGTSMAAPHASGVAALVWSLRPELSSAQVKDIIMGSVTNSSWWQKVSVSSGVINAHSAVARAAQY